MEYGVFVYKRPARQTSCAPPNYHVFDGEIVGFGNELCHDFSPIRVRGRSCLREQRVSERFQEVPAVFFRFLRIKSRRPRPSAIGTGRLSTR